MKTINAGYLHEGTRRHRALSTVADLAELFFGDKNNAHCPIGCDWLTSRGRNRIVLCRQLRALQSCALVTFVACTNPKVRGGKAYLR